MQITRVVFESVVLNCVLSNVVLHCVEMRRLKPAVLKVKKVGMGKREQFQFH
jgi:hypothetical protein